MYLTPPQINSTSTVFSRESAGRTWPLKEKTDRRSASGATENSGASPRAEAPMRLAGPKKLNLIKRQENKDRPKKADIPLNVRKRHFLKDVKFQKGFAGS